MHSSGGRAAAAVLATAMALAAAVAIVALDPRAVELEQVRSSCALPLLIMFV